MGEIKCDFAQNPLAEPLNCKAGAETLPVDAAVGVAVYMRVEGEDGAHEGAQEGNDRDDDISAHLSPERG